MTSMLLTESAIGAAGSTCVGIEATWTTGLLSFLAAIAQRDLLFSRVLGSTFLDHLFGQRAVARHERRQRLEFLAVPLLELDHARAFMIGAAGFDRGEQARSAELLQPRFAQVEVLEAPAHLLRRHHLALAEMVLRHADRL